MKHQIQVIVIYKDSDLALNKYFGPFVSQSVAERFMDELPAPLLGGSKTFKTMQPFTAEESLVAAQVIYHMRKRGDLLEVIHDIVSSPFPP